MATLRTALALAAGLAAAGAVAQGSPALCVQRILCDAADSPLQFENVTYRADAFSYKLDVRR